MADITFNCPECNFSLEVDARGCGKVVNCPFCHEKIIIPPFQPYATSSTSSVSQTKACPYCAETILVAARKCRFCGELLDSNLRKASQSQVQSNRIFTVKQTHSRGIYIILAILLGLLGIHNFYAGYYTRGAAQFLLTIILGWFFIGIIINLVWILLELVSVDKDAAGEKMT